MILREGQSHVVDEFPQGKLIEKQIDSGDEVEREKKRKRRLQRINKDFIPSTQKLIEFTLSNQG